jgi:two-component SAPR family response regulator
VQAGRALESAASFQEAQKVYARALIAEPLSEALHQGMIRCHIGLGQRSEAMECYEALRERFALELGLSPSAETEILLHGTRPAFR